MAHHFYILLMKEYNFKLVNGCKISVLSIYRMYYKYTGSTHIWDPLILLYIILETVIRSVPVKAHNFIKMVKYYYSPLYCIYYIIIAKLLDINKDIVL